jgi:murein hydrolase activator
LCITITSLAPGCSGWRNSARRSAPCWSGSRPPPPPSSACKGTWRWRRTERGRLEQAQRVRQELIGALGRELSGKDSERRRLQEDRQRLEGILANLLAGPEAELPDPAAAPSAPVPPRPEVAGAAPVVVEASFRRRMGSIDWPAAGALAARFGERRASGVAWDGVLIAAAEGTPVRAVHPGRVVFADWLRGFGLLLILDHGEGYMSLYGYNQGLFKEVGDQVGAGEALGVVGRSGGQEEPGVFFGIRHNGRALDPDKWCTRPLAAG